MAKKRNFSIQPKVTTMTEEIQAEQVQVLDEQQIVEVVQETTEATPDLDEEQAPVEALQDTVVEDTSVAEETVTQAPVEAVQAVAEPVAESKYSETLTRLLDLCKSTGNQSLINYINELVDYTEKMAPGRTMNQETGAANQAAFYTTLINLIDHTGKDFRIAFATLLAVFNEYKRGVFSGAYALRFMEDVPLNKNKRDNFVKLVNLFSMTADAKTRKDALKHIDLKRELVGMSEDSKMRIVAFYTA